MLFGEGQTWFWAFILLSLGSIIGFFLVSFFKREHSLIIIRVFDIFITIFAVLLTMAYLIFSSDLLEPWLIQGAWFIRYNGLFIGFLLWAVVIKTIAGLAFLISKYNETEEDYPFGTYHKKERCHEIIVLLILIGTSSFYILEILLYRFFPLFNLFLSIFYIQICLVVLSLFLISHSKYKKYLKLRTNDVLEDSPKSKRRKRRFPFVDRVNLRLKNSGTKARDFWWLCIPFSIVAILLIITVIIYPFNPTIPFSFPYLEWVMSLEMPIVQLLSYIAIVSIFLILIIRVFRGIANRKYGKDLEKKNNLKIGFFGFLEGMKFLMIFLVICQFIYFFQYPIYFPVVVSYTLLFSIIGAIIYYFVGKREAYKKILTVISLCLLILNFYLTYADIMENASNYTTGSFYIIFPFEYLHSLWNYILVGIPMGIIVSDLMLSIAFKNTDGSDSTNRAVFIAFSSFIGGLAITLSNWILQLPGGDKVSRDVSYSYFNLFCLFLIVILIGALLFYVIVESITYLTNKKAKRINGVPKIEKLSKTPKRVEKPAEKESFQKKAIVSTISAILIISILGGLAIYFTHRESNSKPLLAYSPGNYYVWLQNSSERVSSNYEICIESSPMIPAIEFSLAKNEYHAVQLVWRPLGDPITALTYEISDFVHHLNSSYTIGAGNCSLRYEDFIIEEEFPEILRPFSSLNLENKVNYIFWFSLKTPYNMTSGLYHGKITFNFNSGESETIFLHLNVWNFTIPNMRHLRTNIGGNTGDDERVASYIYHRFNDYGELLRHAETYEQLQTEEKYTCYLNKSADEWIFNWTYYDQKTQYNLDNGMNAFTLRDPLVYNPTLSDTTRDPDVDNATKMLWLGKWLEEVQNHFKPKGWLNYGFFYFIDEFHLNIPSEYTREEYYNRLERVLEIMNTSAPDLRVSSTTPVSEETERFKPFFDIYIPLSYDRDKDRWEERLHEGKEVWFYVCISPMAPWPNINTYNRLYECRILLWQAWYYKLNGFLYWRSHAYYHGRYGHSINGYGDGWLIYEEDGNCYDSLRWENLLDAQEDYEYIWLLDAALEHLNLNPGIIPVSQVRLYREELDSIVNSIVGEGWEYAHHPSAIYNGRDRIGTILDELGGIVNLTQIGEAQWLPP